MLGEFVDCSNSLCYNGGIRVGSMRREAVDERKTEFDGKAMCQGYEGSPSGRRRYRTCINHFEVRGKITYKEPGASSGGTRSSASS